MQHRQTRLAAYHQSSSGLYVRVVRLSQAGAIKDDSGVHFFAVSRPGLDLTCTVTADTCHPVYMQLDLPAKLSVTYNMSKLEQKD